MNSKREQKNSFKEKNSFSRVLSGVVVSCKMKKTVTILVSRRVSDPFSGKTILRSTKYHAHDTIGLLQKGSFVEIQEGRPISKTKSWFVTRLLKSPELI